MNLYHKPDQFRASDDQRNITRPPEATEPTQVMIETLMQHVRNQFYDIYPPVRWLQEQKQMLMILTWPASWCNQRGIHLPLAKYESIIREIIVEIQRHGDTGKIKHFPTYFKHTVQQWFIHNGEGIYEERKGIRDALDLRFLKGLPAVSTAIEAAPMEKLLAVHQLLATSQKKARQRFESNQSELF